ncbi:MAG: hypothetical protein ACOCM9_01370, partial [Segatella copri]
GLHRFLRLDCKFVECHILISFLNVILFYFLLSGFSSSGLSALDDASALLASGIAIRGCE